MQNIKKILLLISLSASAALLTACGGGSSTTASIAIDNSLKAPANLTATNTGDDGSIQLTWESVSNVSYRVHQVATAVTDNSTLTNFTTLVSYSSYSISAGTISKEITGLSHGTTYYFAVTSIASSSSESALSNLVSSQPSLSAPTNLNATSVGDAQASLSWTGIKHASATYTVHYATAAFTNITPNAYANLAGYSSRNVTATSADLRELSNGVQHFAVVTAVINGQHSAASSQKDFTPILTAPSNLSGISNNEAVSLTWDGVADATYKVYYSTSTLENKTPAELKATGITAMDNVSTNSANVTSLVNGTAYYFVVTAVKAGVESLPSAQFSVAPGATVPANLTVGTATENNQAIKLTWGGIGSASAYTIHQATASFGSNPTAASLSNAAGYTSQTAETNTQLELTGLANGTTYYFVVTAITDNGESTPSNQVNAMPNIAAPQNLSAETSEGQAKLSWETVAGASYVIHQATAAFIGFATLSSATDYISHAVVVGSSKTTIDLINGKTYHFVINAVRNDQHSAASNPVTASPILPTPQSLSATAGISQVSLSWNSVVGATYKVYYATTDLTDSTSAAALQGVAGIASTTVSANNAVITNLTNDTTYYFVVTALKSGVESVPSAQASALPTFPAPTNLAATTGASTVSLNWTAPATVSTLSYTVHRATVTFDGISFSNYSTLAGYGSNDASTNSATITGLSNGTLYYFIVTAVKDGVHSAPTNVASATVPRSPAPTGLVARSSTSQQITLSWNALSTATSYKVYYGTQSYADLEVANFSAANGSIATVDSTTASTVTHTIQHLTNGALYYFAVTAELDSQESAASFQTASPHLRNIAASTLTVSAVAFSPDGNHIASASVDNSVRIWNSTSGVQITTLAEGGHYASVAYSPDGSLIAISGSGGSLSLWDATTYAHISTLTGHNNNFTVNNLVFNTRSSQLASGSIDGTARIWTINGSNSTLTHTLGGHTTYAAGSVHIDFNPAGSQLITGDTKGDIRLWNTASGAQIGTTLSNPAAGSSGWSKFSIWGIVFSPTHEHYAVAHTDTNAADNVVGISIHNSTSNQVIFTVLGHADNISDLAYTPNGKYVVSGSRDATIKVWDAINGGAALETFTGHNTALSSLAVSPDGKRIVSSSLSDGTIRVWYPEVLKNAAQ